ncbi:MAG: shikimate kinase [Rubrobacter sp.]
MSDRNEQRRTPTGKGSTFTVALIGYMGSGKSTVGRLLARDLDLDFLDLDEEVERAAGMPIPEIFAAKGEAGFRNLEHECLKRAVARKNTVVACGGGIVTRPENLELLSGVATILIEDDLEALYERTRSVSRPLRGGGFEEFRTRYKEREELYRRAADFSVRTKSRGQAAVAREISDRLYP